MKDEQFCIYLIQLITEALLKHSESQSKVLKIITIGVKSALKLHKDEEGKL
jgi:hypothetical protein